MTALNRVVYRINLNMYGTVRRRLITAIQGDKATRYIVAQLHSAGEDYIIPDGAQVFLNAEKPDGTVVYSSCTFEGSEVTAELKSQTLEVAGSVYCDIEIRTSDGSQVVTTESFEILVNKSVRDDDAVESSNEMSALQDATARANAATANANSAATRATEAAANANAATANANSAATRAIEAAEACEGIVGGHNTLIDTVTGVAAIMTLEDSILCIREA